MIDWLRDTVLAEGNIAPVRRRGAARVRRPDEVLAILEDVQHRRPRAA